mgnify:FL=1
MVRILKAVDIGILADLKLAKSEELSSQEDINIIKIKSLKIFNTKDLGLLQIFQSNIQF